MDSYIIDSWAWIEYLRGTKAGLRVRSELERGAQILTHVITLAEIVSKVRREGLDVEAAWKAVTTLSKTIVAREGDSKDAGLLHAAVKAERPNFSLSDAFVLQAARKVGAKILTGDRDFRNFEEIVML